jgi:replicative DNA helicase
MSTRGDLGHLRLAACDESPRNEMTGTATAQVKRRAAVQHVSDAITHAIEIMEAPSSGIASPFAALNRLIVGGFQKGELIYLGARPGVGKTAMALEIARHAARSGARVLIVSREMLAAALARRMLAQEGRLAASKLKLGIADKTAVAKTAARLADLPIWITDAARTLSDVADAIDSIAKGVDLLIVDYLQLVQAPKEIRDRRLQVESVSQGLKAFALARALPVVCLSSLSRPQGGISSEPTLAPLRESGELEHDADIVIFLHRASGEDDESTEVVCIVAKNRDGETGRARLIFRPEWVSFVAA